MTTAVGKTVVPDTKVLEKKEPPKPTEVKPDAVATKTLAAQPTTTEAAVQLTAQNTHTASGTPPQSVPLDAVLRPVVPAVSMKQRATRSVRQFCSSVAFVARHPLVTTASAAKATKNFAVDSAHAVSTRTGQFVEAHRRALKIAAVAVPTILVVSGAVATGAYLYPEAFIAAGQSAEAAYETCAATISPYASQAYAVAQNWTNSAIDTATPYVEQAAGYLKSIPVGPYFRS